MARHSARIIQLLAAGIIVLIFCVPAAGQKWGEITDSEKVMGPPEQFPEAPAMILFDIGQLELKIGRYSGQMTMERHVRIKVFKKSAADDAIKVEIPCIDKDEFAKLEAETIAPDGSTTPVKDFFIKKIRQIKYKTFTFPAVVDGAILEYHYVMNHNSSVPTWEFHSALFTARSQFSVAVPEDFPFVANRRNIMIEPKKTSYKLGILDGNNYTYEARNLEPAKDEPLMRARGESVASISLMYGDEDAFFWPNLGRRYHNWIKEYTRNQKVLKAAADSLCTGLTSTDEKTKRLFQFVQDNIKDAASSDKIKDAEDVLRQKRGYDDDKNILLSALLNSQKIPAHVVFIGTRDEHGEFNPAFHHRWQLNRWICYVDKDSSSHMALDAADEYALYPYVPKYDLVKGGLLIDSSDSKAIAIQQPERKNGTDIVSTIWVRKDGSAVCTSAVNVHGYSLEEYHEFFSDTVSSETMVKKFIESSETPYTVVSAAKTLDKEADELKFDLVLEFPTFASVIDSTMFFRPYVFPIEENYFTSDRRFFPVDYYYTFLKRHRIQINLPEGMVVSDVPVEIRENIGGASFSRKVLAEANVVNARADFKIESPCFIVKDYPQLKALYGVMAASVGDKVAAAQAVK